MNSSMERKTIHISFGKRDEDLYDELITEAKETFIPLTTLVRNYVRCAKKQTKQLTPAT